MSQPANLFPIPVERLTEGLEIDIPGFGFAEVYAVRFDGESYLIRYCTNDAAGWDALDDYYVKAGETVEHAYVDAPPYLRSIASITEAEWEALHEAEASHPALRPGVEFQCLHAVAEAIGVSVALPMAAE